MTEDLDPVSVLCELSEEAMRRLGDRFHVTVKGDYQRSPLTLTITVDQYGGEGGGPDRGEQEELAEVLRSHGYSERAVEKILEWYR